MGRTGMAAWLRDWPGGRANSAATARDSGQPGGPNGRQAAGQGFEPGGTNGDKVASDGGQLPSTGQGPAGAEHPLAFGAAVRCGSGRAADPQDAGRDAGWATEGSAGGGSSSDR